MHLTFFKIAKTNRPVQQVQAIYVGHFRFAFVFLLVIRNIHNKHNEVTSIFELNRTTQIKTLGHFNF